MALTQPRKRLLLLSAFGVACLGVIGVLLGLTGMHLSTPYELTVTAQDAEDRKSVV